MAERDIRCAIIGCGRISSQHIEGFLRSPHVSIAALCDLDPESARRLASEHRLERAEIFSDYRLMLDRLRPDIVSIAAPDREHPEVAAAALESGAHVLCEKPLALSPVESDGMVRSAAATGKTNGVRMPYRFSGAYRYVKQWIGSGNLGKPLHIRGHQSVARLSDPQVPLEWRMRRETGGFGALSDLGSHLIDLAYFLLEGWTDGIAAVSGLSKIFYRKRLDPRSGAMTEVTAPDAVVCALAFASGCIFNIEASRVSPGDHFLHIDGTEGSIRCDGEAVWTYRRIRTAHQLPSAQLTRVPQEELLPLAPPGLFEEFVRCCRTGAPFSPSFAEGAKVVNALARIYDGLRAL